MKTVNEKFTEDEFKKLNRAKKKTKLSWHDFIMTLAEKSEKKEEELKNDR